MTLSRRSFMFGAGAIAAATVPMKVGSVVVPARNEQPPQPRSARDLQALLNEAGESAVVDGQYSLSSTVVLPHRLRSLELAAGTTITVNGDRSAFTRAGDIEVTGTMPPMKAGSSRLVAPRGRFRVGDYVLMSGHDTIPGSIDKYGYIRRVIEVTPTGVELDSPIPRAITRAPRCGLVSFAPPIRIFGRGKVVNAAPHRSTTTLIDLLAVNSPVISGIEVANNGGPGITLSHCWGGDVDAWIHDLLDDGERHFGYGVNVAGASRRVRVGGSIARVRHAVTTNPGPAIPGFGYVGEPEDCTFEPAAWDCTNKAIDTHRAGWGTTIIPDVRGGRGGVQIRADNTTVLGGTIIDTAGPGIAIEKVVAVRPRIIDVAISGVSRGGNAILALAPVVVRDTDIRGSSGVSIVLSSNSNVSGGSIDAGNEIAVEFRGDGNTVTDVALGTAITVPYKTTSRSVGNAFTPSSRSPSDLSAPVCIVLPTIKGSAEVGSEIAATAGRWSLSGLEYEWSWRRDGSVIERARSRRRVRYRIREEDVGSRISVEVTTTKPGHAAGRALSLPTSEVPSAGALTLRERPQITGSSVIGDFLYASKGTWSMHPDSTEFEWRADGEPISGATNRSYQLQPRDSWKVVSVRVTARRTGYDSGVGVAIGVLVSGL